MNKKIIIGLVTAAVVLAFGVVVFIVNNSNNGGLKTTGNSQNGRPEGNALVNAVFVKVRSETPTVKDTRAVTEDTDSNNLIGKSGEYQYAGNFYDTRTNYKPINDNGEETSIDNDNYGNSAGGSIEIFASSSYAKKRGEYLAQFQAGLINAGPYRVVKNVVLRVSENYTASEQKQMLDIMQSAL